MSLYLIVGQEFKKQWGLDELNTELGKYGLIADPSEREREYRDKFIPGNIRRKLDAIGTNRFDYVELRPEGGLTYSIIVGKILDEAPGFWTASADPSKVIAELKKISGDFPQARAFAVYADPDNVNEGFCSLCADPNNVNKLS